MGAADAETLAAGTVYLKIQMVGFVSMAWPVPSPQPYGVSGDSRTAMIYNLTANAVNVVFNYLLINGHFGFPRLEVAGASLATILGQFVAFGMALRAIMRRGPIPPPGYQGRALGPTGRL